MRCNFDEVLCDCEANIHLVWVFSEFFKGAIVTSCGDVRTLARNIFSSYCAVGQRKALQHCLTSVVPEPSITAEQATSSYSFRSPELSQSI